MKWTYETEAEKYAKECEWHNYFAWWPIKYKGCTWWLERIERRYAFYGFWEYRDKINGEANES